MTRSVKHSNETHRVPDNRCGQGSLPHLDVRSDGSAWLSGRSSGLGCQHRAGLAARADRLRLAGFQVQWEYRSLTILGANLSGASMPPFVYLQRFSWAMLCAFALALLS